MPKKSTKKQKKLKKPVPVRSEPHWDFHQVIDYIEKKYEISVRDYAGKFSNKTYDETTPYLDFWHWLIDGPFSEINNGSYQYLDLKYELENEDTPDWVKEILQKIYDEFQEDEMEFWVEW